MLFTPNSVNEGVEAVEESSLKSYVASLIISEFMAMDDIEKEAFMESAECQEVISEGLIGKNTFIQLSKLDDAERRIKMASYQLARENNDPKWTQMIMHRTKEKELGREIKKKYYSKAKAMAKVSQKEYIKKVGIGRKIAGTAGISDPSIR